MKTSKRIVGCLYRLILLLLTITTGIISYKYGTWLSIIVFTMSAFLYILSEEFKEELGLYW